MNDLVAEFGTGYMTAMGACIRHGGLFSFNPDTVPSVWIHTTTRAPVRPDGSPITPGEPDTVKEPLCRPCAAVMEAYQGRDAPVLELFPYARLNADEVTYGRG